MKSRHKVALAVLVSLGILTWAPAANAKGVNPAHEARHDDSSRVINVADHHSHLDRHLSQHKAALHEVTKNSISVIEKQSGSKKAKSSLENKAENSQGTKSDKSKVKLVHHRDDRSAKASDLTYNHTQMPNQPQLEKNRRMIGGMNQFVQERKPYRYLQVGGNTRDLGGYPTADHKYRTMVGRIIRSAGLDGLSKSGANALQRLHVNQIVDLRYQDSKNGIQGHPDPNELHGKTLKGTHIVYQKDPVYSHDEAKKFGQYMKHHDVRGEYYFYGAPSVTEPQAIRAYRRIFSDLLSNHHGAVLFHCNLGRDRTGVTSALILSALGVDRSVIYHDYLLTDHYHYRFRQQPYAKPAGELEYFFNTIDQKYGGVNNYLRRKIGLTEHGLHQLRSMYLVPVKKSGIVNQSRRSRKDVKRINHRTNQK